MTIARVLATTFLILAGCSLPQPADPSSTSSAITIQPHCAPGHCGGGPPHPGCGTHCGGDPNAISCDSNGDCTSGLTAVVDLISGSTCSSGTVHGETRLINCAPPTVRIHPLQTQPVVPVRTTITVQQTGDCNTEVALTCQGPYFKLMSGLTGESQNELVLHPLAATPLVLRGDGGAELSTVALRDLSPQGMSYDPSCSVRLVFNFSEPDIDTKEQAQAFIAKIQNELTSAHKLTERYRELLLYYEAHDFLTKLAASFHQELTNDLMNDLRSAAYVAAPAFSQLLSSCPDAVSAADQQNLTQLLLSLPALGDPANWKNPDGTTGTLYDFLGPAAQDIEKSIAALEQQSNGGLKDEYTQEYNDAAAAEVALENKLREAQAELAKWLS